MSLAVVFKGPEGLVLAADSRVTMMAQAQAAGPGGKPVNMLVPSYYDNARKLLTVQGQQHIGIVTYGAGAIGQTEPRTADGYMPEFEAHLASICNSTGEERLKTEVVAEELGKFFDQQWQANGMPPAPLPQGAQPMVFLVAGFDDGEPYGRVYEVSVPTNPKPVPKLDLGLTIGGQHELVNRLLSGVDPKALGLTKQQLNLTDAQEQALADAWTKGLTLPIPYQFLPLQDCVDLVEFLVSMTTIVQTWMVGIRGVGGQVDVATITRTEGFKTIRQKTVQLWG